MNKVLELKNNHYSRKNNVWREEKENIITDYVENELSLTDISKKYSIKIRISNHLQTY